MMWLKRTVGRRRLEADLSEEIRQHLDEKIDALVEAGLSRADAAAVARREFGNVASVEERSRDVWRWIPIEDFLRDIRFAVRQLRRQPSFALVALLTLALAIGANTAVFSIVNTVLLRPLPFPDPDRLVSIQSLNTRTVRPNPLSYPNFFDARAQNRVFDRMACYHDARFTLTASGQTVELEGEVVSSDLFAVLGIPPAMGRGFLAAEETAGSRVAVLGYGVWQGLLGSDPNVVGRPLAINGEPYTIVGVAPAGFRFPYERQAVQLWTTIAQDFPIWGERGNRQLNSIGRLAPGVTIDEARAQMDVIAGALAVKYPDSNANHARIDLRPELERTVDDARSPLLVVMAAVALVLLVACANIAGLLLVRSEARAREFAVRASIGASRQRLVRQLLTEGLVLALLGGTGGVVLATVVSRALPAALGDYVPRIQQLAIDRHVLLFAAAVVVTACVAFSTSALVQLAKAEAAGELRAGVRAVARGGDWLRRGLIVGQIASSVALVTGAGLLTGSVIDALKTDAGFMPDGVVKFGVSLPSARYDSPRTIGFYDRLFERLAAIPGVQAIAGGGPLPLTGNQMSIGFTVPGRPASPADRPRANVAIVTPDYFRTLGIRRVEGRDFTNRDDAGSPPVVIVNQAFADRFFPGEDAVGRTIRPGIGPGRGDPAIREIVGVVGNARQVAFGPPATPIYYLPFRQVPWFVDAVVVRTTLPSSTVASIVRQEVAALDKAAAVHDLSTLDELRAETIALPRFLALVLAGFAAMALLLAAVGLYGVISHSVARRTNEIGVRMALGATRGDVLRMILRQAMGLVGTGLAIGFAAAFAASQVLAHALQGVGAHRAALLALACWVIALAGSVAAYFPARRAASIEPLQALRAE